MQLVYVGPGLSGKTTTLQYVYAHTVAERLAPMTMGDDRVLSFAFQPRTIAAPVTLSTVAGAVYLHESHRALVEAADGLIFVADSQRARIEANAEILTRTLADLAGRNVPLVFQYNKRDLPEILSIAELDLALNPHGLPAFEAVAHRGEGVMAALRACALAVDQRARTA